VSKYRVVQTLPKGQQPGETVELNDDEARVFLTVGAVRTLETEDDPPVTPPKSRRQYARRDLKAEA